MQFPDIVFIFQWWFLLFIVSSIFLPLTTYIFSNFFDKGYIFSKILGIAFISYAVLLLGVLKILPFGVPEIIFILICFAVINLFLIYKHPNILVSVKKSWRVFAFEELLFLSTLIFWSFIRAHQSDIHGLEKYMDFGFVNSILRSSYFPPNDMWFTPHSINYYYFGHLVTAVLTKLSAIPSPVTFNLMLSTIFAFTFTGAFSIGANLIYKLNAIRYTLYATLGGLLSASVVTFSGNIHTIYTLFKPYANEHPLPFWQLIFSPASFPNSYWYPNATRFIYNTIHEFPLYSFVVSDLHGHVLDIPFVLLTIAILFSLFLKTKLFTFHFSLLTLLLAFLLAIMYMTNAWDGILYFGLMAIVISYLKRKGGNYWNIGLSLVFIFIGSIFFTLPFSLFFKPFASNIGILCAPDFLIKIGHLGPFIFEPDHCQKSPWWQLITLYGFFYFWVIGFFIFKIKNWVRNFSPSDVFVLILIAFSTLLIILPEFVYIKDIYPAHYRANTMFKLVYQSFIMLSIASGYIIVRIVSSINKKIFAICYLLFTICLIFLVFLYPYFAINSYYNNLKTYAGLNGTDYLKPLYPTDYEAIQWINKNIKGQPVILEAQGDSYTDYARVSTNTGLPTVLGWTVHEWLWRGTYDIPAPRIEEVKNLYEAKDIELTKQLIKKYDVKLVFIGDLEKQKYLELNERKFKDLGTIIYENGNTKIYKINN